MNTTNRMCVSIHEVRNNYWDKMMKKVLKIFFASLLGLAITSCEKEYDKVEDISAGMFYESYWSSRQKGSSEIPYYTMKFSGTNQCRLRHYLTESVDVDLKAYYSAYDSQEGIHYYAITDYKQDFAHFRVDNDSTLTLWIDDKAFTMHKQSK